MNYTYEDTCACGVPEMLTSRSMKSGYFCHNTNTDCKHTTMYYDCSIILQINMLGLELALDL